MFKATHNETGEVVEMTEEQVRAEIVDSLQHDMETCAEFTDEEIALGVNESDVRDYLGEIGFEGRTYSITA